MCSDYQGKPEMKLKNILFALGALMLAQVARADDKAMRILQETVARTTAAQTLQTEYRTTGQAGGYKHTRATGTMRAEASQPGCH